MKTLVIYESMYGNTHAIATQIALGCQRSGDVKVVPVGEADAQLVDWADLVVVGGPTHAHGMTSSASRKSAQEVTQKPDSPLELDPDAAGPGLRDWLRDLGQVAGTPAVAFDTRVDAPAIVTGRASRGIAKRLRQHGFRMVAEPESFLVTKDNQLVEGEAGRAVEWASSVLSSVGASR